MGHVNENGAPEIGVGHVQGNVILVRTVPELDMEPQIHGHDDVPPITRRWTRGGSKRRLQDYVSRGSPRQVVSPQERVIQRTGRAAGDESKRVPFPEAGERHLVPVEVMMRRENLKHTNALSNATLDALSCERERSPGVQGLTCKHAGGPSDADGVLLIRHRQCNEAVGHVTEHEASIGPCATQRHAERWADTASHKDAARRAGNRLVEHRRGGGVSR